MEQNSSYAYIKQRRVLPGANRIQTGTIKTVKEKVKGFFTALSLETGDEAMTGKVKVQWKKLEKKAAEQTRDFGYFLFSTGYNITAGFMEASRKMRDLLKPLPAGVKVESFYYGSSNNPMHQGNVYTPVFQKPIGIVIDIHGGCWNHGDKDVYHHFSYDLARRGFQVLSLTYSLGDEITQKEQVQDVFAFLHYISKNKAGLHLANKPAVLCGDSAGAQLSLLSLYINQNEHMQKLFQVKPVKLDLQALILMHPVCFIRKALHFSRISWLSDNLLTPGLLQELYGHSWKESQLERLSDPAVFDWKDFKLPPVLIVTSAGDRFFGKQSSMLASLFQKHHVGYELYQERDARAFHTYHIVDPEDDLSKKANAFIENFILKAFHHTALQGS